MKPNCFDCENITPNGECYIGMIENCPRVKDYLFLDNESGEEFFVECESKRRAFQIAHENFGDDVEFIGTYSVAEAEILGYDTY